MAKKKQKNTPEARHLKQLRQEVATIFEQNPGATYTLSDLTIYLGLGKKEHLFLKTILDDLAKDKLIKKSKKGYALSPANVRTVEGIISIHSRGFGFIQAKANPFNIKEVFIPPPYVESAADGDNVLVAVDAKTSQKGPEGKVIKILERKNTHLAGIVHHLFEESKTAVVLAPLLGKDRIAIVVSPRKKLNPGDRVLLKVTDWGSQSDPVMCRLTKIIGHIDNPKDDTPCAIKEFNLRETFPRKISEELKAFSARIPASEVKAREDLRDLETVTIDPNTAKDFDDAITLSQDAQGNFELIVHIADVSHFVRKGSELDREASLRGNSTYFPNCCLPMLPPKLSENLCSLKPGVPRLASSVFLTYSPRGILKKSRTAKTIIKSDKRFTYEEALQVLEGKKKSKHSKTLKLMETLCGLIKKEKKNKGIVDLALPEIALMMDEKGQPTHSETIEYDITHQMIEEFMVAANEEVAKTLSKKNIKIAYRIHEAPLLENLKAFSVLANALGYNLPPNPERKDIQKLFENIKESALRNYLATSYIRCMKMAVYSPENIGHYGLGLEHYCHFTSPIRRYSDLVVHRLLFGEIKQEESLDSICLKCSETERLSAKSEAQVRLLKKFRFIKTQLEEDPSRTFVAIITKVKPQGFLFELENLALEGFIHISELNSDYFLFDSAGISLKGRYTGESFRPGKSIRVRPAGSIDLISLETKWELAQTEKKKGKPRKSKKKMRSK